MTLAAAVNTFIKDGAALGIGGFVNSRQPLAIVHEIIRQGRQDLTLMFQSAGLAPELLAGAMALRPGYVSIKRMELAYFAHEYAGISPLFRHLAENQLVEIEDWSNYNMSARFKAGAMGVPFLPTRSPLGSDVMRSNRSITMPCPFTGRPVGLVPAAHPDVALIHVQEADLYGNCRIQGQLFTCPELAMAAGHTIVTCERLVEEDVITNHPTQTSIPFFAVDAVVEAPFGAFPGMCHDYYYYGQEHMTDFIQAANHLRQGDQMPLKKYYQKYIIGVNNFDDFISQIPYQQLKHSQQMEGRSLELQKFLNVKGD